MTLAKLRNAVTLAVFLACSAPLLVGCPPPSKVAQGQRYTSGDNRFDPYFDNVHQQQVAASSWSDDRKAARRSLVTALSLTPDASEDTILSATRDRAKKMGGQGAKLDLTGPKVTASQGATADGALFAAIEECARAAQDRVKKLKAASEKLEEMAKQGDGLRHDADKDIENSGAQKADDEKMAKRREIRNELAGASDSMRSLARDAKSTAKDEEEFLEDLAASLQALDTPKRSRHGGGSMGSDRKTNLPAAEPPKEEPKAAKPPAKEEPKGGKPPAAKPAQPPAAGKKPSAPPAEKPPGEKPPPAEKPATPPPAQKPPDEVFSP